jgi:hypothetical protein
MPMATKNNMAGIIKRATCPLSIPHPPILAF